MTLLAASPPRAVSTMVLTSLDRKSTRLNSSHLVISYAVFCLKKRKHRDRPGRRDPQERRGGRPPRARGCAVEITRRAEDADPLISSSVNIFFFFLNHTPAPVFPSLSQSLLPHH